MAPVGAAAVSPSWRRRRYVTGGGASLGAALHVVGNVLLIALVLTLDYTRAEPSRADLLY